VNATATEEQQGGNLLLCMPLKDDLNESENLILIPYGYPSRLQFVLHYLPTMVPCKFRLGFQRGGP
jgi:hypothetical protein